MPDQHQLEVDVRKSVSILAALLLSGASGLALAHNCPNEMKAIDAKLSTKPALSPEDAAKVARLRADGEAYHKAGKHDDAMKSLGEAKKILGI
jgi:cytochrome c-type biogenesis protein CcmH/NrfG